MMPCPDEAGLLRFVDGALSVEETDRARAHIARCARCGARVDALRTLFGDLAAADVPPFDAREHVRGVRERIDRLERAAPRRARRTYGAFAWAVGSLAAVALTFVVALGLRPPSGTWQARGGEGSSTVGRDVGVQIYATAPAMHPLSAGAMISPDTPLTAGFRNLGRSPAFLLLFAVDERRVVHWISPAFARREDDPPSTVLPAAPSAPSALEERWLSTTAVLEDVPPGALRLVAVITATPAHVADVEALEGSDVSAERIERAIPGAEVRETRVRVAEVADIQANPGGHP
jgi:hypothetical protein